MKTLFAATFMAAWCAWTAATQAARTPATHPRPAFSTQQADKALAQEDAGAARRVIAMSLYGDDPDYTYGTIENAVAVKRDWPTWTLRVYHDQRVAPAVLRVLQALDVDLVARTARPDSGHEAMFWRFDVITDPTVTRFIIRDSDARLTHRDKAAVDEWVQSRKYAHTMRDHPLHFMPIMGGLWGAVGGFMPPLTDVLSHASGRVGYNADQAMLHKLVWPTFRKHALIHDAYYCFDTLRQGAEWKPFPVQRTSVHDFVGNKYAADNHYAGMTVEAECPSWCRGNATWTYC